MVRWKVGPTERRPVGTGLVRLFFATPLRRRVTAYVTALPVGSRMRRLVLRQAIRISFHTFNQGELWASTGYHSADAVVHTPFMGVDFPESPRGGAGAAALWRQWASMWVGMRRDCQEVVDAGDRILVLCRQTGRGRDGLELQTEVGLLFSFQDGEVVDHREFLDHDEALRALEFGG